MTNLTNKLGDNQQTNEPEDYKNKNKHEISSITKDVRALMNNRAETVVSATGPIMLGIGCHQESIPLMVAGGMMYAFTSMRYYPTEGNDLSSPWLSKKIKLPSPNEIIKYISIKLVGHRAYSNSLEFTDQEKEGIKRINRQYKQRHISNEK